jgi:DNA polymerase-3 subunit epsilon
MGVVGRSFDWLIGGPRIGGAAEARLGAWRARPPADLGRAHERTRYVVVDVEMAALDPHRRPLPEIGAVAVSARRIALGDAFPPAPQRDSPGADTRGALQGTDDAGDAAAAGVVATLIEFLEWAGKGPLVVFGGVFDPAMFERGLKVLFGVPVGFAWLDLAVLLPVLFRGSGCVTLDDWLEHFGLGTEPRNDTVGNAFAAAQLLLVVLAAADAAGIDSPAQLLSLPKARR